MTDDVEQARSSAPATIPQVHDQVELSASDREAAQAVSEGLPDAKAANTRRAYQTAWHLFCEWTLLPQLSVG
jgi:hypothetical protein